MKRAHANHDNYQADIEHKRLYHWLANELKVHAEAHLPGALATFAPPNPNKAHELETQACISSEINPIKEKSRKSSVDDPHIVVILGVHCNPDGTPSEAMQARIDRGYREALRDPQARIVVTGAGVGNAHIEAEVMAHELLKKGIDQTRLIVEPQAQNTISNATRSWLLLPTALSERAHVRRLTVVTEPYHMVRALRIFSQLLSQVSPHTILGACPSEHLPAVPSRRAGFKPSKAHRAVWKLLDRQAVMELCRNVEEKWRITYGW